jgi:ankyrin repeat protein
MFQWERRARPKQCGIIKIANREHVCTVVGLSLRVRVWVEKNEPPHHLLVTMLGNSKGTASIITNINNLDIIVMMNSISPSSTTIAEQLWTAVEDGNIENIRLILQSQDAKDELTDDHILRALCSVGFPGTYQRFEHPIEACSILYESLSESGKELRLAKQSSLSKFRPLHRAAWYGRKDIVEWWVLEKGYNVNQEDEGGRTPLTCAADPLNHGRDDYDICKFLLENGALVNDVDRFGSTPLDGAVRCYKTDVIRLLLEKYQASTSAKALYLAILCFHPEILTILLQHGGRVEFGGRVLRVAIHDDDSDDEDADDDDSDDENADDDDSDDENADDDNSNDEDADGADADDEELSCTLGRMPLNEMFIRRFRRYSLRNVCRVLVNHARKNIDDTRAFLLASIADERDQRSVEDYLLAGLDKNAALLQTVVDNRQSVCRWLVELGADPFSWVNDTVNVDQDLNNTNCAWSPFQVAASLDDMTILRYFLNLWKERFSPSNTGGKSISNGDAPIHALCRYPFVSLNAIKVLVGEYEANVSQPTSTVEAAGSCGTEQYALLPFHLAVMSNTKLDVVYYLLRQHPDALSAKISA